MSAIAETILAQHGEPPAGDRVERAVEFLLGQSRRMPDYLRLPLRLLTLAFDAWPILAGAGRPFHQLPLASRTRTLEAWKGGRPGVRQDLMAFYERLTVFGAACEAWEKSCG